MGIKSWKADEENLLLNTAIASLPPQLSYALPEHECRQPPSDLLPSRL